MKNYLRILAATVLTTMPALLFAQAPNLGSCATFALFTSVGALANAGSSTAIVGDIGTNSGAITGYPPTSVSGQIHTPDAVTAQAASDLQAAYDDLGNQPCPTGAGLAGTLGGGQLLTPGTYCISGAASVTGDLILDGQNRANTVFIFKINGAFSTAAASRVVLRNGADAKNVYWYVPGAVSFAAKTAFAGTIVAHGAIDFGDGASLRGRALSVVGAISTSNTQITTATGSPLPVTLVAFTAQEQSRTAVVVTWSTASEQNSASFEVERSTDGTRFSKIGTRLAAGYSTAPLAYTLTDKDLPVETVLYYRLHQVDADHTGTYSSVCTVARTLAVDAQLLAYPNPTHGTVHVQLGGPVHPEPLLLLDEDGQVVRAVRTPGADEVVPLTGLPAGVYVLLCGPLFQRLILE